MLSRRDFFDRGGLALAGFVLGSAIDGRAAARVREPDLFVAIVLRGGADGLGMVIPFTEREYYRLRPTSAIAPPGTRGSRSGLDLDGRFALHPGLAPLLPFYRNGTLGVVHACGVPGATRSHLSEQRRLDDLLGTIATARGDESSVLDLRTPVATTAGRRRASRRGELGTASSALARSLQSIARASASGGPIRTAIVESASWDHHGPQRTAGGALAAQLDDLAQSVAEFVRERGDRMASTALVTVSEFGRSVAENADGGTDHGQGSAMLVMSGGLRGGIVHGRWPGLDRDELENGALAVTTDVRNVIAAAAALDGGAERDRRVVNDRPDRLRRTSGGPP